jgi:hypothetical protein
MPQRVDPCTANSRQDVSGSIQKGNEKSFSRLAIDSAKNPLPFNRVAHMILAPTELAFVDF